MPPNAESQTFQKVGENFYRHNSSRVYYALVKRNGRQIRKSLKTSDRKLAERRLKEFRDKVNRLDPGNGNSNAAFELISKKWLEMKSPHLKEKSVLRKQSTLKALNAYFGRHTLRGITRTNVDQWVSKRSPNVSASTFNKEREVLINILAYGVREGILLDNCADHVKRRKMPKNELVIPSVNQFKKMVDKMRELDPRYTPAANLVELLAYSGMRLGEATSILWKDINFKKGTFTVTGGERGTKNLESRVVPLFPSLKSYLGQLWDEGVFEKEDRIAQSYNAKKAISKACEILKLPHFNHHSMRHFFVSNAIEAGVDFKTIAAWVGHKDGGMLVAKTYGHLRDPHSHEMAKRMTVKA